MVNNKLKDDLKKIIPVWAILVGLIIISVIIVKISASRIINFLEYPEVKVSHIAKSYYLEGEKYWIKALDKADKVDANANQKFLDANDQEVIRAKTLFEKSIFYSPTSEAYNKLADLAQITNAPADAEYYQGQSIIYEHKTPEKAKEHFLAAIKIKPDHLPALFEMAKISLSHNETDAAREYTAKYINYSPESGEALYLQGKLDLSDNKADEAIEKLKKSLSVKKEYLDTYYLLSICFEQKNDIANACKILEESLKYFPNHPTTLHMLGNKYLEINQPDKACDAIKKALEQIPSHPTLNFDLARAYKKLGKDSFAAYYLKKAIDLDPNLRNEMLDKK